MSAVQSPPIDNVCVGLRRDSNVQHRWPSHSLRPSTRLQRFNFSRPGPKFRVWQYTYRVQVRDVCRCSSLLPQLQRFRFTTPPRRSGQQCQRLLIEWGRSSSVTRRCCAASPTAFTELLFHGETALLTRLCDERSNAAVDSSRTS